MSDRVSFLGLALLAVLFASLAWVTGTFRVGDPDVYWVAAAGRWMIQHHAVPRTNLFAITDAAHPWIFHEWFFGVPYALCFERIGIGGMPLVALFSFCATMTCVLFLTVGRSASAWGWVLGGLALAGFSMRLMTPRATHVSLIFPVAMYALAFRSRLSTRDAVAIVLLEGLWASAHGSFPLGFALLGLSIVEGRPEQRRGRALVLFLAAVATMVNPYGWTLHRFVWRYLTGNDGVFAVIHSRVEEFSSIWEAPGRWLFTRGVIALFGLVLLALFALRRPGYRLRTAFVLVVCAQGCFKVRGVDLAGLLGCVMLLPALERGHGIEASSKHRMVRRGLVFISLFGLSAGVAGWASLYLRHPEDEAWMGPRLGGADLVTLAKALPQGARVLSDFTLGGVVLWYGADRDVRVMFDPRNDPYSAKTAEAAFELLDGHGPITLLGAYGVNRVLVFDNAPLAQRLKASAAWRLESRSGPLVLYRGIP